MNVGVDFDHTLFDTDGFYQYLEETLDTPVDRVKNAVQDVVTEHGDYRLQDHAERIAVSPDRLEAAYSAAPQFFYNRDWLREQAADHRIVVVTRDSHKGWQDVKTRYAGLQDASHVDDVRIVSGDETKYFDDLDVLIDDSPHEIRAVENAGMHGIYLDRPGNAAMDGRGVTDLADAAETLEQLAGNDAEYGGDAT